MRAKILATALAAAFGLASLAASGGVAEAKNGKGKGWGKGHGVSMKASKRHYGWTRGRHLGWYKQPRRW